jgi:hypothetical protein
MRLWLLLAFVPALAHAQVTRVIPPDPAYSVPAMQQRQQQEYQHQLLREHIVNDQQQRPARTLGQTPRGGKEQDDQSGSCDDE